MQRLELLQAGYNQSEVARMLAIPRPTIRDWHIGRIPDFDARTPGECEKQCGETYSGPQFEYAYLLSLYLGDDNISTGRRFVYKLRVVCDNHIRNS
jgi:hypothetical protein